MQIKLLQIIIAGIVTRIILTLLLNCAMNFVNGVLCVKPKMRPSHIVLRYVDVGDSELIQLAYNSRECQLSNKTSSSPFGS